MMSDRETLYTLLSRIEAEMCGLNLWDEEPPEARAFDSQVPFCADVMSFPQWLQWVFIPRFRVLLDGGHPLPSECSIHPMSEEAFKEEAIQTDNLTNLIKQFDHAVVTGAA